MTEPGIKKYKPIEALGVFMHGRQVGLLSWNRQGTYFTYAKDWLTQGFNLSPQLTFDEKPQQPDTHLFLGIHGAFADSLPDGWGLLLMGRFFTAEYGARVTHGLTQLDRLAYIGNRGMGALEYYPMSEKVAREPISLSALYEASIQVQVGETVEVLKALRIAGGSPGGARPKAAVAFSEDLSHVVSAFEPLPEGYAHWIVKFRALQEPWSMGAIECAYARMARTAGVAMAHCELITVPSEQGRNERFFATRRFDRQHNRKVHMMTAAGILHADFRIPCLDYKDLLRLTFALTKSAKEVEKMARLMVFNGLAHNYDDHAKNFAFLYEERQDGLEGQWVLAPAYDLTFSTGMGEHTTAFDGQGRPSRKAIRRLCADYKFLKPDDYIDQTLEALGNWETVFGELNILAADGKEIFETLKDVHAHL
ncbi:serine/threonine-protein kinase HipA [Pseudomonas sp. LAMO17WK12:I10]|uniref:type II toxin-antitoxin system HipA family toxin n=1 Tax=unclassified Pseudomonas TaxID=196821 RepID=UPI000BC62F50|nr:MULTISPECIES: type II toxin-antitoxin system HipA family toxin [unclassified Pseudomonas]PXX70556.1 serine/threonine-protein kinase HipA [Pseudomonas sp. LAMO17WK12:I9]SNY31134.1 serine/threonine-protein kinase HipA [Pseudomonas sp. LAMO17WK12:I10]